MLKSYNEMNERERVLSVALLSSIILTIVFIFFQSLLFPSASTKESESVAGFLSLIFSTDGFLITHLRQIAHFAEYGMLGIEVSLYVCFFGKKTVQAALLSFLGAQFMALLDETVQIFSGRAADVVDVWTDFLGFLTLSVITYLAFFGIKHLITKKDKING